VHVPVHFRNNSGQPTTAVHNVGHHDRGPGHDGGMHIGYVLPLSDHIRYHVGDERGQFLHAVHGAGTTDVAQVKRPNGRGGRGGQVVGLGPRDGHPSNGGTGHYGGHGRRSRHRDGGR